MATFAQQKMKYLLITAFVMWLGFTQVSAQCYFINEDSNVGCKDNRSVINGLYFTSELTGYASCGYQEGLRKTTDGGLSWATVNLGGNYYVKGVHFLNSQIGLLACSDGVILKSVDAGATWKKQNSGTTKVRMRYPFLVSETEHWMVGEEGWLLHTTDGGETWVKQPDLPGGPENIFRIYFRNAMFGFLGQTSGGLFRTIDGGKSWVKKTIPESKATILNFEFINDLQGWAVGVNNYEDPGSGWPPTSIKNEGLIYKTMDGGETWQKVDAPLGRIRSMQALNSDTAFITGQSGVFMTKNGGLTWDALAPTQKTEYGDLHFPNKRVGYAASGTSAFIKIQMGATPPPISIVNNGNEIYASNIGGQYLWYANDTLIDTTDVAFYTIKKSGKYKTCINLNGCTTCSNTLTVSYTASNTPSSNSTILPNHVLQLFPNPANTSVKIKLAIPTAESFDVEIVNMLGNVVALANGITNNGVLDIRNLPVGLHIIRAKIGTQIFHQKLMVK